MGRVREEGKATHEVARDYNVPEDVVEFLRREVAAATVEAAEQILALYQVNYKGQIIEMIFDKRWDQKSGAPMSTVVSLDDVSSGITEYNKRHRTTWNAGNRANFFKDFIRNLDAANANWPKSVWERGYTGWQLTGDGRSFEFVRADQEQKLPFPKISPPSEAEVRTIGTLNLPLESKRLGRADESWLTQVAVRLALVESHFAFHKSRSIPEIVHLQMNVKQSGAEIDSMYRALERIGDDEKPAIIVCEAKGARDDILISQLIAQAENALRMKTLAAYEEVTPVAIKVIGQSLIQIADFEPVMRAGAAAQRWLGVASNALHKLKPDVQGID